MQNSMEKRASRFLRVNFTYNFGKENSQLFHRKENKNQPSNQPGEGDLVTGQQ
jgi:hypothetical protein